MKDIVLCELFSGTGSFSKGLLDAGFTFKKHYYSEIDKHAIANYKYNFKDAEYIGSVTDVRGNGIERPDIITFGSPCQDFSLAGKQLGMDGKRSVLILEAIRIIRECKPGVFIWENVKGAFSSNDGADFWAILSAFANIGGYRLEWQLLNTSWFLPQNRERIYLVGHLAGRSEPGIFPIGESDCGTNERLSETSIVRALTAGGHSGGHHSGMTLIQTEETKGNSQGQRIYKTDGLAVTLSGLGGGQGAKTGLYEVKPVLTPDRLEKRQNGRRFKEDGEDAFTLSTQDQHGVMIGTNIRRLTEIECERLQGLPDDWTKYGIYEKQVWINKKEKTFKIVENLQEIPRTQRYKLCGNAVTKHVVQKIGSRIKLTNI